MANSLFLQLGNKVVKEAKFVSNSFVVVCPKENVGAIEAGEERLCPSDVEVAGNDDVVPGISAEFTDGVASWDGVPVHDSDSELLR